ncbi:MULTISPECIES: hypothetical protein [unclassified Streptomyces]|uniref:hypothetical protein n=1 Tax=unclassified Streptomyces TaxID=2593676 RepID=UPI001D05163B|nr:MULTISPECIES: hypothetical protein [unclassified Streptomyces]
MTHLAQRVSAWISAFGVLAAGLLLVVSAGEYRAGASVLWPVGGASVFLGAVYALVRDVRRLRTRPAR